jgi:hypothetical protein
MDGFGHAGFVDQPGDQQLSQQISVAAHAALRLAVAQFRASEPRRSYPPVVHVGRPGGGNADFVDLPGHRLDHALRTEVAAALLSRAQTRMGRPVVWLTRVGGQDVEDVDLRWYAATRAAYGEAGVPLAMYVVTKVGWCDPRTGGLRTWKRLRIRG